MNFKDLLEKVESSKQFEDFKQKHPDSELVAGFFIRDFLSNDNKSTLDYKIDSKVLTFSSDDQGEITMKEDKLIEDSCRPELKQIDKEIDVEVDELKSIAGTQALDNGIASKFSKIIAVLQKYKDQELTGNEEKQIWNLTCMLEGLIILNILIDAQSGKILKFERKSMMDLVKKK